MASLNLDSDITGFVCVSFGLTVLAVTDLGLVRRLTRLPGLPVTSTIPIRSECVVQ